MTSPPPSPAPQADDTPTSLHCVEIVLRAPDEETADAIEGALWEVDVSGIERHDDETWTVLVEDPRPRESGTIRWRLHIDGREDIGAFLEQVRSALPADDRIGVDAWELTDMSFLTAWREHFRPTQVSPRLIVHPPWDRPAMDPGTHGIEIEPGMAFGTGTHETTRLCLQVLDRVMRRPGLRVLDVGTGTGILAIGAALLGASEVLGTENDPAATRIARENAALNDVKDRCRFETFSLDEVAGGWDLVVANILPHVLIEMREDLVRCAGEGGTLVLSGILLTERDRVVAAFEEALEQVAEDEETIGRAQVDTMGEWCAITWERVVRVSQSP